MNAILKMEGYDDVFDMPEAVKERFRVTDANSLNWAFRKLSIIEQKKAEVNALAAAEMERIKEWQEKELNGLEHNENFFHSLIAEYAAKQREADPDFKKQSTPYGAVKFVKDQAKWVYNESALIESLKAAGRTDLIRVKEEPDKVELKKVVEVFDGKVIEPTTGAILEGVTVEEAGETLKVEVSK